MGRQRQTLTIVCCALYMIFPVLTFIDQHHTLSFLLASLVLPLYFLIRLLLEPKNHQTQVMISAHNDVKQLQSNESTDVRLEHPMDHDLEIPMM
jgi:hypothetical protein